MKESEELIYISEYLPKMMSEEELKLEIEKLLVDIEPIKKNMGLIMKSLSNNADKKIASKILSNYLK